MPDQKHSGQSQRLSNVLQAIADGIIIVNAEGLIAYMNPAALRLCNRSMRSCRNRPLDEVVQFLHPRTREPVTIHLVNALERASSRGTIGIALITNTEGHELFIEYSTARIGGSDGEQSEYVLTVRDITKRRYTEKRASEAQNLNAIGQLAHGMAHDFDNLIELITGYASSLRDSLVPATRSYREADLILETASHAHELTARLLAVARAGTADFQEATESVDIFDSLNKAMTIVDGIFLKRLLRIDSRLTESEHYRVQAHHEPLLDMVVNILLNAADALPEKGLVTMDVRRATFKTIDPRWNPNATPGPYIVFRIRDNGQGIAPENLMRVFDPFYTTREEEGSMGLGLTIARNACQRWGGWIRVRSQPGRGSSFRIFLPEAGEDDIPDPAVRRSTSVVLVGGDEQEREQILAIHPKLGYSPIALPSALDVIPMLNGHSDDAPDVIICIHRFGHEGLEQLLAVCRDCPSRPAVIVTSGFTRDVVADDLKTSSWTFLQKPFTNEQLKQALDKVKPIHTRISKKP